MSGPERIQALELVPALESAFADAHSTCAVPAIHMTRREIEIGLCARAGAAIRRQLCEGRANLAGVVIGTKEILKLLQSRDVTLDLLALVKRTIEFRRIAQLFERDAQSVAVALL